MANICDVCTKGPQSGNRVSFSQRHTRRRWVPNVQKVTIRKDGQTVKLRVCTRCLRTLSKRGVL